MDRVIRYCRTCGACPAQWEGELASGDELYIRYRWGVFKVYINPKGTLSHAYYHPVLEGEFGDAFGGVMSDETMKYLSRNLLDWRGAEEYTSHDWNHRSDDDSE